MQDALTPIKLKDTVGVICFAIFTALVSEFASWVYVYGQPAYIALRDDLQASIEKLNTTKETAPKSLKANAKVADQESDVKAQFKDMGVMQFKAGIASTVVYMGLLFFFQRSLAGRVVAHLPFEPMWLFKLIAHSGLKEGYGPNDCSSMYLFALTISFFRTGMQKLLNLAPPKSSAELNNPLASFMNAGEPAMKND